MRVLSRVIAAVLVLLAGLGCLVAPAALGSQHGRERHRAGPVVLHPRFHLVSGVSSVLTNGRYVFLEASSLGGSGGTVIDEQTGRRTMVNRPGCAVVNTLINQLSTGFENRTAVGLLPGDPWLLFECDSQPPQVQSVELYSFVTGQWRSVTPLPASYLMPPPCYGQCPAGDNGAPTPIAVGAHWIAYGVGCHQEHCTETLAFQNIDTGQVPSVPALADWRAGGRTIPDLNSPQLAVKLCSPLRVPRGNPGQNNISVSENAIFAGSFAIAVDYFGVESARPYLERCGSRLHKPIDRTDSPVVGNPSLVLWELGDGVSRRLDGLFLPSLRPFTLVLPLVPPSGLVLSSRTLYEFQPDGKLLAASSPTLPRSPGIRR